MTKTYTFHVHGMHCRSCVILTESELREASGVASAVSSLATHTVRVEGDFGDRSEEEIAEELSRTLESHGYRLSVERQHVERGWSDFRVAVPVAAGFAVLFVVLQKIGIVNLVDASSVSYATAFLIGVIASLSTCMAVVGGLVLSMSASYAKEGERARPQLMFHLGRIVAFFVLGGVIGAIGSAFSLSATASFALGIVIGLVMLVMGINLLDVFPWAKKLQPAMPKFLAARAHGVSRVNHVLAPLLVGVATFFLPCGFTQAMQLYTLTTGSFLSGGLTMLAFALGTLPVLALISFSSYGIRTSKRSGVFFKAAGLIVIMFALLNLANSLVAIGVLPPLFSF